ncbi:MAG: aldehyde dehydrogenase family protein [Candidatus Marinimicrobia bacterium]|nr:aldehyde dehydrogenase family protein [Candidatus Neomarinimicrobiota bacterium]
MSNLTNNFIAGNWVEGGSSIANINPSDTNDNIGQYAQASISQLEDALNASKVAQQQWAMTGLEQRQAILMSIGEEMMARSAELGELLSREEGKPLAEGKGEVYRAGQFFTYYAAEVLRQSGDTADSVRAGIEVDVRREAMGTVAIISPWNFPTATASWKIAPALAFGNAVIWKPANMTPASAVALSEIISRQDMPEGLFNLVMGSGSSIGQKLAESPQVDAISFTGSYDVGRQIAAAAAKNLTKFQLELGSKNPLVVMDDADIDVAVAAATAGAYGSTGQKCTASSRLVVHEKIHDEFVDRMKKSTSALKVGHALEDGTQIGPAVSQKQLNSNLDYMNLARKEGCEVICGGDALELTTPGYYMQPALLTGGDNAMKLNREELFAPIACVIKVADYDEALKVANDTDFGLVSGIITRSLARASHFRRNAEAGCVMVNLPTAGTDYHVPFGGRKNSSFGPREQGQYAKELYTQVKTSYILAGKP